MLVEATNTRKQTKTKTQPTTHAGAEGMMLDLEHSCIITIEHDSTFPADCASRRSDFRRQERYETSVTPVVPLLP
jgi:hypothetical protein